MVFKDQSTAVKVRAPAPKTAFAPQFYMIGAQKAGTTTLAALLGQHPGLCVADPKEPRYFSRDDEPDDRWYRGFFRDPDLPGLDASTTYSMALLRNPSNPLYASRSKVAERIATARPDARFIYVLREPCARTWSGWRHSVEMGRERRPFLDAIQASDTLYLDISDYHGQLRHLMRHFPLDRFLLLDFDDIVHRPVDTARACFRWVGLDDTIKLRGVGVRNSTRVRNPFGRWLTRTVLMAPFLASLRRSTPERLKRLIEWATYASSRKPPRINPEALQWMQTYFAPRNARLAELTGRDFSSWAASCDAA